MKREESEEVREEEAQPIKEISVRKKRVTPRFFRAPTISSSDPARRIDTANCALEADRKALSPNGSTPPFTVQISFKPTARAVRMIVPKFPGSAIRSSTSA